MLVMGNGSFNDLFKGDAQLPNIFPLETWPRHSKLYVPEAKASAETVKWIAERWKPAYKLYKENQKFKLALDALDSAQFVSNPGLALVSIWAAMEQIFISGNKTELGFKLSTFIASYMEEPGELRLQQKKLVNTLYGARSKAAHGNKADLSNELLESFSLIRRILLKMIYFQSVPTDTQLEQLLFGTTS